MPALSGLLADAGPGQWGPASTYVGLALLTGLHEYGRLRLAQRPAVARIVGRRQVLAGRVALATLWVSLCGPVDRAADAALWVHMIQHLLVGLVAPLLWCLSRPVLVFSSVLDRSGRRAVNRWVADVQRSLRLHRAGPRIGVAAVVVHVGTWWAWHLPVMFDWALRNDLVHGLEHGCLFLAGLALWSVCLGARWHDRGGLAIFYLFGAAVGTGLIGAFLTLLPTPLYATTTAGVSRWGLTRLSDQQLGGVIMWVVGGAVYLVLAAVLAGRWLSLGPSRDRAGSGEVEPVGAWDRLFN